MREGLEVIASLPWRAAGTGCRHGGDPGKVKADLYRAVVDHLDTGLHSDGSMGMIVMDGAADDRRWGRSATPGSHQPPQRPAA